LAHSISTVRGMRRHSKKPRERILTDDELRLIWKQAGPVMTV
jgi:hypothetical protein